MSESENQVSDTQESAPLTEGGMKALQAERDARKQAEKALAELKNEYAQLEAANVEKLQQQEAQMAETAGKLKEAAEHKMAAARFQAALNTGLKPDLVDYLKGETYEEFVESAQVLQSHTGSTAQGIPVPKVDPSQGAGTPPALNSDTLTDALAAAVGAT